MPNQKEVVWKHIGEIEPIATSHGVGEKRVIASQAEIGKPVTQIARTVLRAGERVEKHIHLTMDEHFFFLEGACLVKVDSCGYSCKGGDYLFVPAIHAHELDVDKETTMITIGIEINEK